MAALMPPSATPLERALDDLGQRPEAIPVAAVAAMKHPAAAPERLLAWLAWERSVDDWPADAASRRRVIAVVPAVHRAKGTPADVETGLAARGYAARIVEWFDATPRGRPHTFAIAIEVRDRAIGEADHDAALGVVMRTKNPRGHLDRLTLRQTLDGVARTGAGMLTHETVTVFPPAPEDAAGRAPAAILEAALAGDCISMEIVIRW